MGRIGISACEGGIEPQNQSYDPTEGKERRDMTTDETFTGVAVSTAYTKRKGKLKKNQERRMKRLFKRVIIGIERMFNEKHNW